MSTEISGRRAKIGPTQGDVRVVRGGKLVAAGHIAGTLTVEPGGYANVFGMVDRLVVKPGAKAKLRGMCTGDVNNLGGDLTVSGHVKGVLYGRSATRIMPRATVARYGEAMDYHTSEEPLPGAAELASMVIDDLTAARWADVRARFDATMNEQLSEEELAAPWPQITEAVGAYQGRGAIEVARAGQLTKTTTPLRFDAGAYVARIAFRDDHTIAGLYIQSVKS